MPTDLSIARPRRCSARVEHAGDTLTIRRRSGSLAASGLFAVWLIVQTLASYHLTLQIVRQPTIERVLFAIPIWTSWVVMANLLTRMLFGSDLLRIGPDGLAYRSRALVLLQKRRLPLAEIKGVSLKLRHERYRLEIESVGRPLSLDVGQTPEEGLWLEELILRHLQDLRPDLIVQADEDQAEVLLPDDPPTEPPSDCMVHRHADWDGTTFVRRGSLPLAAHLVLTLAQALWLLKVCESFCRHFPGFGWFVPNFFLTYGAGGFVLSLAFVSRFWVERWTIGQGVLTARFSLFGLGRSRCIEAGEFAQIELRKHATGGKGWDDDGPYVLGVVGREGQELLAIDDLTEGEARWMGGYLCQWLKGSRGSIP